MGFSSQPGQLGFGIQSVRGTPVAATKFMRLRSGSLGGNRDLLIPDPEIGGSRDTTNAYLGPIFFSGDLDFYPRMQSLAILAYGVFGAKSSTTVAGPPLIGTHVITPANTLPWLTIEERLGTGLSSFQYTDAKVNTLHLEGEANGYIMGTAGLLALSQISGFTAQPSPVYDLTPMMTGTMVTIDLNGDSFCVKNFAIDINNNIEDNDFCMGSNVLHDAVEKQRELTMSFTYRPDNDDLWTAAMYGDPAATAPLAGPAYQGAFSVLIESFETIGAVVSGTPYSVLIEVPHAAITPFKITPSGDDVIQIDLEVTAIRPTTGTPLATITVVDNIATVV